MMPCSYPGQRGFAYLWLLLLLAFVALNSLLVVELTTLAVQRDREKELLAIGEQFRAAIRSYYQYGDGSYPISLDDLLEDNRAPAVRRHLRKLFVDPMTGKAEWGLLKVNGRITGVYSQSDRVPHKQAGFLKRQNASLAGQDAYTEWVFTWPADLLERVDSGEQIGTISHGVSSDIRLD